jgi:hypothetical protein
MMEAFRPPAGSQRKQFPWTLWTIALAILGLAIWFAPDLLALLGAPAAD